MDGSAAGAAAAVVVALLSTVGSWFTTAARRGFTGAATFTERDTFAATTGAGLAERATVAALVDVDAPAGTSNGLCVGADPPPLLAMAATPPQIPMATTAVTLAASATAVRLIAMNSGSRL